MRYHSPRKKNSTVSRLEGTLQTHQSRSSWPPPGPRCLRCCKSWQSREPQAPRAGSRSGRRSGTSAHKQGNTTKSSRCWGHIKTSKRGFWWLNTANGSGVLIKTSDNDIWLLNMNKAKDPTVATPFSRSETSRLSLSEMLNSSHTSLWRKWEYYWQWW